MLGPLFVKNEGQVQRISVLVVNHTCCCYNTRLWLFFIKKKKKIVAFYAVRLAFRRPLKSRIGLGLLYGFNLLSFQT